MNNCTAVRLRPLGTDENGDLIEGPPNELVIDGATVAPRSSSNIEDRGRNGVIVGLSLYTPFGADIVHGDLVRISGLGAADGLYEIDGEAGPWKSPFTQWEAGVEVALKRAAG